MAPKGYFKDVRQNRERRELRNLKKKMLSRGLFRAVIVNGQRKRLLHSSSSTPTLENLKKLTATDSEKLVQRLAAVVGEKNASLAEVVRSQHGQDEGPDKGVNPDAVVFPHSTEEVSEVKKTKMLNC